MHNLFVKAIFYDKTVTDSSNSKREILETLSKLDEILEHNVKENQSGKKYSYHVYAAVSLLCEQVAMTLIEWSFHMKKCSSLNANGDGTLIVNELKMVHKKLLKNLKS